MSMSAEPRAAGQDLAPGSGTAQERHAGQITETFGTSEVSFGSQDECFWRPLIGERVAEIAGRRLGEGYQITG
jgi:hypothetical protein